MSMTFLTWSGGDEGEAATSRYNFSYLAWYDLNRRARSSTSWLGVREPPQLSDDGGVVAGEEAWCLLFEAMVIASALPPRASAFRFSEGPADL